MSRTFWASAIAAVIALGAHAGEPRQVVLDVPSMNCALCPISVRKALERVPGVIDARADLATKSAQVRFDPGKVAPEALAATVTAAGYPATIRKP
ncbi:MAG: heavy-metal-associated domain-containing protein [Betaproteobacteria bacterium]